MQVILLRTPGVLSVICKKTTQACLLLASTTVHPKSTNVDAIDSFTNDLVVRKSLKWKLMQDKMLLEDNPKPISHVIPQKSHSVNESTFTGHIRNTAVNLIQELANLRDVALELDVKKLSQQQIDHLLINALLDERKTNFFTIIAQCIDTSRIPSDKVIFEVLHFLTQLGELEKTDRFVELIAAENPEFADSHDQFSHYRARCLWHQGNSANALDLLKESYSRMRANRLIRMPKSIIAIFQEIVEDTVHEKSEAVLVSVMEMATHLSDVFGENQVLGFVWETCFLSSWFSDQQTAVQMFGDNEEVRMHVRQKTSMLVYTMLQNHNVDAVHRLIELLLKYELRQDCKTCLSFLFEYQYWRQDLRACSEIIRNSLDINVPLADVYNQKLLNLLLRGNGAVARKPVPTERTRFELKF